MDKSNEILFNESALHSLKRAQLVALCKRYDMKQNGKNEELVSRLQIFAQSLLDKQKQSSSTDYVTTLNDVDSAHEKLRESQQWELVEDGAEEDVVMSGSRSRTVSTRSAMSMGTLKSISSAKEFALGSVSSKGSGSVSSSLMSIATSLKRAGSKSSKMSTSTSRSTSTTDSIVKQPMAHLFPSVPTDIPIGPEKAGLETMDGSVLETVNAPLDRQSQEDLDRPIAHGVVDATKLQKERSTIRLVTPAAARIRANVSQAGIFATPKLKPFDINQPKAMDDPKEHIGNAFLALDDGNEDIGNAFLAMDGRSFTETIKSDADISNNTTSINEATLRPILPEDTTASLLTPKRSNSQPSERGALLTVPSPQFIFGSPANAVTNDQFGNAAAAVLEEMNKRLGLTSDSTAAVRLGVDGTIDFGQLTPTGESTLKFTDKRVDDKRFGRAHEKVFGQMESITTHYSARRPPSPIKTGTLVGTKRKSTAFDDDNQSSRYNASRQVICLDDPKDKATAPPPPKRQRVDGADLLKAEKAAAAVATAQENEAALKKAARSRRSSKGRTSTGGSAARRRSVAPVKVVPSGRFGLLRSGAAKVMKTILSTVSSTAPPPRKVSQVNERPGRAPIVKRTNDAPVEEPSPSTSTIAPKARAKQSLAAVTARPSTFPPRTDAATNIATSRKSSQSTTSSARTSLAPKGASAAAVMRAPKPPLQRGSLPVFEAPIPPSKSAFTSTASKKMSSAAVNPIVVKRASAASRTSVAMSTATSRRPSNAKSALVASSTPATGSQSRRVSRSGMATASVASKSTLDSVQEGLVGKAPANRDPDFEPALPSANEDGSRPPSPLPAPPASLSSRPLQRRQPLEPLPQDTIDEKGSLGRKPRISRSKVIAKVQANRLGNGGTRSTGSSLTSASKGRKSGGASMSAKAKLMGGEGGAKARVSVAAEAKRKARVSGTAGARRRTMAIQQAAARV